MWQHPNASTTSASSCCIHRCDSCAVYSTPTLTSASIAYGCRSVYLVAIRHAALFAIRPSPTRLAARSSDALHHGPRRCVERPFAARHGKRCSAPKCHGDASAPCVASHACRPHPLHLEALTAGPLRHPRQGLLTWVTAWLQPALVHGRLTARSTMQPLISTGRFAVGPMTATTASACCITCCCIGATNALFGSDACCATTNPVAMDAIRAIPAIAWCMTVRAMLQSAAFSAPIYSVAPMRMLVP